MLLALCAVTIVNSVASDPYEPVGPDRLQNPGFAADLDGWEVRPDEASRSGRVRSDDGVLTITALANDARKAIEVRQTLPLQGDHSLILSGEVRARNVIPGERPWERARVVLAPADAAGNLRYDVPHTAVSLAGSNPWGPFSQVFRMPDDSSRVAVAIQILNAVGTIEVRSLSLRVAREVPAYAARRDVLIVLWLAMGLWMAWSLWNEVRDHPSGYMIVGLAGIFVLGALLPASVEDLLTPVWLLPQAEAPGADVLQTFVRFRWDLLPLKLDIYKLAHFLLFAAIGYVLRAMRPFRAPVWMQLWLTGLFGLAVEAAQTLTTGRGGSLGDALIDLAGASAGLVLAATVAQHAAPHNRGDS